MDTTSLRGRLSDILQVVDLPESPLLLEPLVRCPELFQSIAGDLVCRDLLSQIMARYQEAEFRYRLLRLVQKGLRDYDLAATRRQVGKSLHDITGAFIWCQRKCGDLFQLDHRDLLQWNLFELMDAESQSEIYQVHGRQLIDEENLSSVVVAYCVRGTRLVSRCTPVYYSSGASQSHFGIFVETRRSLRGGKRQRSPMGFLERFEQPITPSFLAGDSEFPTHLELKRPLYTPSPNWSGIKVEDSDCKDEVFTAFSITPLLSDDGALEKKRKSLDIREFSALA